MEPARIFGFRDSNFGFLSGFGIRVSDLLPVVRLQKILAEAGVASRRASEQIILEGRVSVNGTPVRTLGSKVDPDHDEITVDGKPIKVQRKLYLALHKPRGCVCSKQDELQR